MQHFDLGAAVPKLKAIGQDNLATQIERCRSAHAIIIDLEEAGENIMLAAEIISEERQKHGFAWDKDPKERRKVSALLKSALLAYYRAIDGGAAGRVGPPVSEFVAKAGLEGEQARVLDARHNSIAHYGGPSDEFLRWNSDAMVLNIVTDSSASITFPHHRWHFRTEITKDLARLLDAIIPQMWHWLTKNATKVQSKLGWLSRNGLIDVISENEFVPQDFYYSSDSILEFQKNAPLSKLFPLTLQLTPNSRTE